MIFTLAKIASVISDFNLRRLTQNDFFDICERENIEVVFDKLPILESFIVRAESKNYIFIDENLSGFNFLFRAYHELMHYFLHEPKNKVQVRFYSLARPSREDDEADAAALVCLFAKHEIEKAKDFMIEPNFESDFEREKYFERLKIYERFVE